MRRIAVFCVAGLGVVLAACGSLESNTSSAPALATLRGSLTNTSAIDLSNPSAVRVAVVWRVNGPGRFNVAEDLPVRPVFPASFAIEFDGPPPAEAMNSVDESSPSPAPSAFDTSGGGGGAPGTTEAGVGTAASTSSSLLLLDTQLITGPAFRYAIGTVVAYLDQNHNGKLDLVGDNATAYVDQILAANRELSIMYLEGLSPEPAGMPAADSAGHEPKDGYNLFKFPACNTPSPPINPECSAAPPDTGSCAPSAWFGIDTPYPLAIASDPTVATLMCLTPYNGPPSSNTGTGAGPDVQPAQYPSPTDPNLCCVGGGSSYIYATCTEISQGLCKGTMENCTSIGYERPTPTPSGWPCMN